MIWTTSGWVVTDLNRWEPDFRATIEAAIQRRRDDIFAMRKTEFMLGVPIERDGVIAETYAVPALTRRSLPRPVPRRSHKPFTPEPSIMKEAFANIVTDIGGVLAMFERLPITHSDAGEDRLPDQILVTLGAIYGAGSAESFSKHGKTDIYLPWEGNAVFLAECKWWKGQSRFAKEALPQLLDRYIVWRDTHTAMICSSRTRTFHQSSRRRQRPFESTPGMYQRVTLSEGSRRLSFIKMAMKIVG